MVIMSAALAIVVVIVPVTMLLAIFGAFADTRVARTWRGVDAVDATRAHGGSAATNHAVYLIQNDGVLDL